MILMRVESGIGQHTVQPMITLLGPAQHGQELWCIRTHPQARCQRESQVRADVGADNEFGSRLGSGGSLRIR